MKTALLGSALTVLLVGMLLPLQALVNARLGALTHGALYASLVSFAVGTLALLVVALATRTPLLPGQAVSTLPPWIWLGGLIGMLYVLAATFMVPRLGTASMFCLVVLGQICASLLLDHFGVLGARRPVDAWRVLGALMVLAGAVLVVRPWRGA